MNGVIWSYLIKKKKKKGWSKHIKTIFLHMNSFFFLFFLLIAFSQCAGSSQKNNNNVLVPTNISHYWRVGNVYSISLEGYQNCCMDSTRICWPLPIILMEPSLYRLVLASSTFYPYPRNACRYTENKCQVGGLCFCWCIIHSNYSWPLQSS